MSHQQFTLESGIAITRSTGPELVIIEQGQGPTKNVVTLTANEMMIIFLRLYGEQPSVPCVRAIVAPPLEGLYDGKPTSGGDTTT